MTVGTGVLLSLAKTAAVSWCLLLLVADCSRLEPKMPSCRWLRVVSAASVTLWCQ